MCNQMKGYVKENATAISLIKVTTITGFNSLVSFKFKRTAHLDGTGK